MFLERKALALPRAGGLAAAVAAIFAAGLTLGAVIGPGVRAPSSVPTVPPVGPVAPAAPAIGSAYPTEVTRVLDGDTFDARVRVWPGMEAVTRVRLRGIDAPEMKARCEAERVKAIEARDALERLLAAGAVAIRNVGQDKYGGRVDADVSAADTGDVGEAMLSLGLARRYEGGRRGGWCDTPR